MRRGGGSAHNLKDAGKPSLKPRLADDDIFDRFDDYEENFYSDEEDVEIETRGQKQQDQQKKPEKRKVLQGNCQGMSTCCSQAGLFAGGDASSAHVR